MTRTALTLLTCLSFSFFSVGCYPSHAIDADNRHALSEGISIYRIEKTNKERIRCTTSDVDSTQTSADGITLYQTDHTVRTVPMDSVKYVYTKEFNTIGTVTLIAGGMGLLYLFFYTSTNISRD